MELPRELAGDDVERAQIARRREVGLAGRRTQDDAGSRRPCPGWATGRGATVAGSRPRPSRRLTAPLVPNVRIDLPVFASIASRKLLRWNSSRRSLRSCALPVVDAARRHALQLRVDPDLLAGRGIERHERVVAREHIRDVVDDDRAEVVGRVVVGRIAPRGPKLADVVLRDLGQRAVLRAVGAAAVVGPRGPRRGGLGEDHRANRHDRTQGRCNRGETLPTTDVCLLQSHGVPGPFVVSSGTAFQPTFRGGGAIDHAERR